MFRFSSEMGEELIREALRDLWSHTPRDYQIEAVVELFDGVDVLATLSTGASKTTILTALVLVQDYMRLNPGRLLLHYGWLPEELTVVVVHPAN